MRAPAKGTPPHQPWNTPVIYIFAACLVFAVVCLAFLAFTAIGMPILYVFGGILLLGTVCVVGFARSKVKANFANKFTLEVEAAHVAEKTAQLPPPRADGPPCSPPGVT